MLFSKKDPSQLGNSTILVPKTSATSVALLKILLAEKYDITAQVITETNHNGYDAACLFGDKALLSDAEWSKNYKRYDLGSWWRELTGLPMVFAVWVATQAWHSANPQSIDKLGAAFQNAAAVGLGQMFDEVLAESNRKTGIPIAQLTKYYKEQLNFDLSEQHINALNLFRSLCIKHNLLAQPSHN